MAGDLGHTAFCGLYCRDCVPSEHELFKSLRDVEGLADRLQLGEYAAAGVDGSGARMPGYLWDGALKAGFLPFRRSG